jgi:predicted acylesterase/phospholipase RssA
MAEVLNCSDTVVPDGISLEFFRYSTELKSEMARKLNYLVPVGLRWITLPIFSMLFDKKVLNMDTEYFKRTVLNNTGTYTFQEAFDRTGRIINITVAPLNQYDPPRLLNYLTAPHICVWSAAAASCALPGVFDSCTLIVKDPDGRFHPEHEWTRQWSDSSKEFDKSGAYSDGSLENDLPMQQLSELFNVNHFIVSQVNPHSAILSSMSSVATIWSNRLFGITVGLMRFLKAQVKDWIKNIVSFAVFRSNASEWSSKRGISQALTQEYEGRSKDITIMPWIGHISTFTAAVTAIKNPTITEFNEVIGVGARNTWPHIPRIRAHTLVEHTLDQCVQKMRSKIAHRQEEAALLEAKRMQSHSKALGSAASELPTQRKGMDRTPSFYSTRSLLASSGLSVADPMPQMAQVPDRRLERRPSTYVYREDPGVHIGGLSDSVAAVGGRHHLSQAFSEETEGIAVKTDAEPRHRDRFTLQRSESGSSQMGLCLDADDFPRNITAAEADLLPGTKGSQHNSGRQLSSSRGSSTLFPRIAPSGAGGSGDDQFLLPQQRLRASSIGNIQQAQQQRDATHVRPPLIPDRGG